MIKKPLYLSAHWWIKAFIIEGINILKIKIIYLICFILSTFNLGFKTITSCLIICWTGKCQTSSWHCKIKITCRFWAISSVPAKMRREFILVLIGIICVSTLSSMLSGYVQIDMDKMLLDTVAGTVGAGNFSYWQLGHFGPLILELTSLSGDADLYVADNMRSEAFVNVMPLPI